MTLTFGSLFAGIGGIDLGFEQAGMTCAWQSEIDKSCLKVLGHHWPQVEQLGDVANVKRGIQPVDLICGGFPCQDVSVAGKRKGLAGKRSGLWFEFHRVLGELSPRWVVIENVPGLLSSNGGRDFATILRGLAEIGYVGVWRVLDAQYFGVAQRRRRVFIVGYLGDGRAAQVLLESESGAWDSPPSRETGKKIAAPLTRGSAASRGVNPPRRRQEDDVNLTVDQCLTPWDAESKRIHPAGGIAPTIAGSDGQGGQRMPYVAYPVTTREGQRREPTQDTFICDTLYSGDGHGFRTEPGEHLVAMGLSENQRAELRLTPYTYAVTSGGGKPGQGYPAALTQLGVRRLTPMECERLQGFPDGFTGGQSDSARYRMLGNAVAVPVAEWIGHQIVLVQRKGQ